MADQSVLIAFTPEEAASVAAALTFALDVVGEEQPSDSTLKSVLAKLAAATREP